MNSTLKVPAPEIRTLIEKIKVDLRKRAEKKAKRMPARPRPPRIRQAHRAQRRRKEMWQVRLWLPIRLYRGWLNCIIQGVRCRVRDGFDKIVDLIDELLDDIFVLIVVHGGLQNIQTQRS
jgi:hypothetical protein